MRKGSLLKAAVETAKVAIGRDEKGTALYYAMYRMVKSNGKIRSNMYFECVRLIDKKFEKSSLK